jgi:hypothetical protein
MFRFKIPSKVDCAHVLLGNQSRKNFEPRGVGEMQTKALRRWELYTVSGFEFAV